VTVAPTGKPLPFNAVSDSAPPAPLSLEQYASLCVEIAAEPAKLDETLLRYRITAEQRTALDAYWRRRFAAEGQLWLAFDRAYAAYKKWLAASRAE
jgi:hypothetical protein